MADESLRVRRKIGLERSYDWRQYAADVLTRWRTVRFRHRGSVAAAVSAATFSHATRVRPQYSPRRPRMRGTSSIREEATYSIASVAFAEDSAGLCDRFETQS